MQKKVSAMVYAVLLLLCVASLVYLACFNHRSSEVIVTTVPSVPQEQKAESAQESELTGLIDLNTADSAQLELLPGIGPELAERIIAYRESIGNFVSKEQIMDVEGIAEKRYAQIEQFITVGGAP